MIERTTVRLPRELMVRAKRKAASQGRTLTALIEDGLRIVVEDQPARRPAKRVFPPVSVATGGLQPGVDLENSASLQEADDLAYLARMMRAK